MSARRMVLRNIVRGEQRCHWLGGHISLFGSMEHRRQLVVPIGRPIENLAVQADEDGHDLGVELDAGELLELLDGLLMGERDLAVGA